MTDAQTILIADDHKDTLDMLREAFKLKGFNVLTAENGEKGLEMFREHAGEISAVVTDGNMPEMSGWDMAAEISKISPGMPIIAFSGDTKKNLRLFGPNINESINKLHPPARLIATVKAILSEHTAQPEQPAAMEFVPNH